MLLVLYLWNGLISVIPQALALDSARFSGKWQNQRGSTIELLADPTGNLTGSMKTSVGNQEIVADKKGFPLVGFVNGVSAGFVVRWTSGSDSVTTFSGELKMPDEHDFSKDEIATFTLTKMGLPAHEKWRNTVITEDAFVRVSVLSKEN